MSVEKAKVEGRWFGEPLRAPDRSTKPGGVVRFAIGFLLGALLILKHHLLFGSGVLIISCGFALISQLSPNAGSRVDAALNQVGIWVGTAVGSTLLCISYLFFVTPLRLFRRVTGADDLNLRNNDKFTFWLQCDTQRRKTRFIGTMFATEKLTTRAGNPLIRLSIVVVFMLCLAEGVLRLQGYGRPINYIADPMIGYYPEPGVSLRRPGGTISINRWGMRSNEFQTEKPAGTFRVLMLGDSTLYGGSYLDQRDLYSSRLERLLNSRPGSPHVEILAMSANGWGPFHEHGFIKRFGTFNADLVIVNLPIDDINRALYGLMSTPFSAVQTPPRMALEEVLIHYVWEYRKDRSGLDAKYEARQSQIGIEEYRSLAEDLQSRGAEVMFACLPSRIAGMGSQPESQEAIWRRQLDSALATRSVTMSYPIGLFVGKGTPEQLYHDDVHLNKLGHKFYADFLALRIATASTNYQKFVARQRGVK